MNNKKCIIYGDDLFPVINMGNLYVSDFVNKNNIYCGDKYPLEIGIGDKSGLAQLMQEYSQEKIYKKYWYKSGINESMKKSLEDIVMSSKKYVNINSDDIVLDIASNDGTLLTYWPDEVYKIGIDPSNISAESNIYKQNNIHLINNFFTKDIYIDTCKKSAKVITNIAMFYDTNSPVDFINNIKDCLCDDGLLILQISYTPLMLQQNAFDNIVHEHLAYYTLQSIKHVFDINDMRIIDVDINDVNAGSFRLYITKNINTNKLNIPQHTYDVGNYKFISIMEYEKKLQMTNPQTFIDFMSRINILKNDTINWLKQQKNSNKKVIGYGSSTKGNTLLQYYGITPDLLPFIAERSENKYGMFTIGTGIPIISEDEMRDMKPDYLFVFPWQFIKNFMIREQELIKYGTKFVVPLPYLKIY